MTDESYPVTLIHGPQPGWLDTDRDRSAEADGVLTGHLADFGAPYDLARLNAGRINSAIPGAQEVVRLTVFNLPVSYDSGGATFPSGSKMVIGGQYRTEAADIVKNNGTASPASGLLPHVDDPKNMFGRWVIIQGIPAATTGTVKIRRTATWGFVGPPTVDLWSIAVDGSKGSVQWFQISAISRDADAYPQMSLFYASTWTGTAPIREMVTQAPQALLMARVCPDALPVGFTDNPDTSELAFGSPHWQPNQRWRAYGVGCPAMSPFNRGFTRRMSGSALAPSLIPITQGVARRFGQPELICDAAEDHPASDTNLIYPCLWVGTDLLEHPLQPCCSPSFTAAGSGGTSAFGVPYPTSTVSSGWGVIDIAAGWRELSVWAYDATVSGTLTVDGIDIQFGHVVGWGSGAPTVIDGTITFTLAQASTVGTEGSTVKRLGAAITPPDIPNAVLYAQITIRFTRPSDNGSYVSVSATFVASRRADIPPAWPAAGPGGSIPGGYKAGLLQAAANLGTVTHAATGVSSITFSHTAGVAQNVVGSFLPPSNGVWRARASYDFTAAFTCGEYEQLATRRTSHIGRAGCRFYGAIDNVLTGTGTFTMNLVTVAQVLTAVPSGAGGLPITGAHLTDSNWIFLSITAPTAGHYRVHLTASFLTFGTTGPTVFMALSSTDAYVINPQIAATLEFYPLGNLAGVIRASPPSSPTDGDRYIIAASATGAWTGEDGNVARWDAPSAAWQFIRPDYRKHGCVASTGTTRYWRRAGDSTWSTGAGELMTMDITMAAAGTIYIRLGKNDPDGVTDSDSVMDCLASPVVTWEVV